MNEQLADRERRRRLVSGSIALLALVSAVAWSLTIARANYRECRDAGFTARYCALTHFVR